MERFPAGSPLERASRAVRSAWAWAMPARAAPGTGLGGVLSATFAGAESSSPGGIAGGGGVAVAEEPTVRLRRARPGARESPAGNELGPAVADPTRYEFKMLAENFMVPDIRSWLRIHPVGFKVAYPKRLISSAYFDTAHLDRYDENLAGVAQRRKVRLRWYGDADDAARCVFEVKCKRGRVGWKLTQPIRQPLDLESSSWADVVRAVREELTDELRLYLDSGGLPVLINRYEREYYCSFDGVLRVTLDYDQLYYDQRYADHPNLRRPHPPIEDAVIEFKAPPSEATRLARVIGALPLRVTRCSKYVRGIETCMGYEPFDV